MRLGNLRTGRKHGASGREVEWKSEDVGTLPGAVIFETIHVCRRSSTFVKNLKKFDGYHLTSSTWTLRL
jgi:hypothetical protein